MSLSGARPTVTIWSGCATIRPANGPDSNVNLAGASRRPASGRRLQGDGLAWSAFACGGCQAGMIEVASVPPASDDWVPLPGVDAAGPRDHGRHDLVRLALRGRCYGGGLLGRRVPGAFARRLGRWSSVPRGSAWLRGRRLRSHVGAGTAGRSGAWSQVGRGLGAPAAASSTGCVAVACSAGRVLDVPGLDQLCRGLGRDRVRDVRFGERPPAPGRWCPRPAP